MIYDPDSGIVKLDSVSDFGIEVGSVMTVPTGDKLSPFSMVKVTNIEAERYSNRLSVGVCNRNMVDRSDLVIVCVERREGGAYKMMMYAKETGKPVKNVACSDLSSEPINVD